MSVTTPKFNLEKKAPGCFARGFGYSINVFCYLVAGTIEIRRVSRE